MQNTLELKHALEEGHHRLSAIVACSVNHVIGLKGQLPWHLPADLAHFKRLTLGKYVILGRKTMESIGRPLPGREMIVLSRSESPEICGCRVIANLSDWVKTIPPGQEIMVAGGGEIYEQLLPLCSKVYKTEINRRVLGDAFFPELSSQEWLLEEEEPGMVGGQDTGEFRFLTYVRRS